MKPFEIGAADNGELIMCSSFCRVAMSVHIMHTLMVGGHWFWFLARECSLLVWLARSVRLGVIQERDSTLRERWEIAILFLFPQISNFASDGRCAIVVLKWIPGNESRAMFSLVARNRPYISVQSSSSSHAEIEHKCAHTVGYVSAPNPNIMRASRRCMIWISFSHTSIVKSSDEAFEIGACSSQFLLWPQEFVHVQFPPCRCTSCTPRCLLITDSS